MIVYLPLVTIGCLLLFCRSTWLSNRELWSRFVSDISDDKSLYLLYILDSLSIRFGLVFLDTDVDMVSVGLDLLVCIISCLKSTLLFLVLVPINIDKHYWYYL